MDNANFRLWFESHAHNRTRLDRIRAAFTLPVVPGETDAALRGRISAHLVTLPVGGVAAYTPPADEGVPGWLLPLVGVAVALSLLALIVSGVAAQRSIPQGPQSVVGQTGAQGPQGPKGEVGPVGPKGDTGPKGETGPSGPAGAAAAAPTPPAPVAAGPAATPVPLAPPAVSTPVPPPPAASADSDGASQCVANAGHVAGLLGVSVSNLMVHGGNGFIYGGDPVSVKVPEGIVIDNLGQRYLPGKQVPLSGGFTIFVIGC